MADPKTLTDEVVEAAYDGMSSEMEDNLCIGLPAWVFMGDDQKALFRAFLEAIWSDVDDDHD